RGRAFSRRRAPRRTLRGRFLSDRDEPGASEAAFRDGVGGGAQGGPRSGCDRVLVPYEILRTAGVEGARRSWRVANRGESARDQPRSDHSRPRKIPGGGHRPVVVAARSARGPWRIGIDPWRTTNTSNGWRHCKE